MRCGWRILPNLLRACLKMSFPRTKTARARQNKKFSFMPWSLLGSSLRENGQ
jgi:hypothetical protein